MNNFNNFEQFFEESFIVDHPKEDYVITFERWKEDMEYAWNESLRQVLNEVELEAERKEDISVLDVVNIIELLMDK